MSTGLPRSSPSIALTTGVPISEHHRRHREQVAPVRAMRFVLDWPTLSIDRRIAARVDAMLAAGWEAEVKRLLAEGVPAEAPGLDAVGYAEIVRVVRGEITRSEARETIVRATRQFAKRQRTWFRAVEEARVIRVWGEADFEVAAARIAEAVAPEMT